MATLIECGGDASAKPAAAHDEHVHGFTTLFMIGGSREGNALAHDPDLGRGILKDVIGSAPNLERPDEGFVADAQDNGIDGSIASLVDDGLTGFARLEELASDRDAKLVGNLFGTADELFAATGFGFHFSVEWQGAEHFDHVNNIYLSLSHFGEGTGDVDHLHAGGGVRDWDEDRLRSRHGELRHLRFSTSKDSTRE